ncbi:DNA alkylation repair protein [Dermatobacter hominis]|uniref:DNA alkylation repair protein n=1 Tax=Dermatobacter hominis TaxID=2884263 RepID=UPI001D112B4A|nr:DNA alkylation repair protein [Dermatobacter hominis]UDY36606.1 DNA alkylation repair protein [Dermatobacter hominis]
MGRERAADVVGDLEAHQDAAELPKVRSRLAPDEPAIGMRMRDLFAVATTHRDLPLAEVHVLLDHPAYEPRMAAWCILDLQARRGSDHEGRARRFEVYDGRHDRITTWDMVDRTAPRVVGGHLAGGPYHRLHEWAGSPVALERRTAITAPLCFVQAGSDADVDEGLALAATLARDPDPLVHLAVGTFLKHAGTRDPAAVASFLDHHAASMARPAVRSAASKLDPAVRARFVGR